MDVLSPLLIALLFFVVIVPLVLIHELGHFIAARRAKITVHEFGIGFPPRAKVLGRGGDTVYTLNWLPLGGFVKLEGEDGDDSDNPHSFANARLPTRIVVIVAGVLMNVVLAFLIFFLIALLATPVMGLAGFQVQQESPAATAGIVDTDTIVGIDGHTYDVFDLFGGENVLDGLRDRAGDTVTLTLLREDGTIEDVVATLRPPAEAAENGALGIDIRDARFDTSGLTTSYPLPEAFALGVSQTEASLRLIVDGLGRIVQSALTDPTQPPPASGPIGIAVQLWDILLTGGPIMLLFVAGLLSANLALVNILPIPPLDGGRVLMMLVKSVAGKRVSMQVEQLTYFIGFIFLFAFIIWVSGFDVARVLGG